ncbi:MAG: hypothetical protein KKF30_13290 [Proteobacteria bacterium]|nr:hypothetical protein [Pseudomonadota bacterium]MBU4470715.1 hypothetical protein [Pseudomonadota bacterium]MCG2751189.1 hypothetical protein [Desulfobacteraceae bacterium]
MVRKRFSFKLIFSMVFFSVIAVLAVSPALAYDYGIWTYDGYLKSQFGVFTEGKPFNEDGFGSSNDNIATARQQLRFNLNGQVSDSLSLRAELLAAWEPDYPNEKGIGTYGHDAGHIVGEPPANYYNTLDWRELTLEYKPTYSHTIRFGRQIVNWGEAISGRVLDQCNPVDSRYLLGFTNLEETYMPLWMFRGIHDFADQNTTVEWIAAPIWQADRYEHSRRMLNSGGRSGDGVSYGGPWYRYGANPEGRVSRFSGADMVVYGTDGTPARIYGPPFADGYHGSDLLTSYVPGTPIQALTAAEARTVGFYRVVPVSPYTTPMYLPTTYMKDRNILWTEFPSTDGTYDKRYPYNYTDHNLKNTRWGIKTKSILAGIEGGVSFYQGPALAGTYHYRDRIALSSSSITRSAYGRLIYEYLIPRENTFGLYGNYQFPWAIVSFEGAYKPSREYHKNLYGLAPGRSNATPDDNGNYAVNDATNQARLNNIAEKDLVHTLVGFTREQEIPLLNKNNVFTFRTQWGAIWALENMDDVVETTTYWNQPPQVDHEFTVSISTAYSYRKYNPSVVFVVNPRGQVYSSAAFGWVVDGFNDRLNVSVGYTNIWGANDYSTPTVLAAKNDLAVLTVQYSFY